jgi:histidinol-phosphate/aromatic aminotransferase/cobyric acid decarboxylase-like protein
MDAKWISIVLIAVAAISLLRIISQWRRVTRHKISDWDEHFINQLRKAGVNPFEDQRVDFFLTLPSQRACSEVSASLKKEGYEVDVRPATEGSEFSLHAQQAVRLVVQDMQARSAQFRKLAEEHGGSYDNWAVARKKD